MINIQEFKKSTSPRNEIYAFCGEREMIYCQCTECGKDREMKIDKYFIFWSDEDGCFVALIPQLPGLSAFGDTPEEALKEALVAAGGMLKVLAERTGGSADHYGETK